MSKTIDFFSPNMLKTFEQCPRKFKFKYIEKISMPVNDDIFETGKNIHALASYYLKKENIDNMELSLNSNESKMWKYLKECKYFSYDTVQTEYNLSVKIGGYFFGGRLDALLKNENQYYILDYKTGSAPKNAKYDYQTMIYLLCVKEFFKTDNVTFIYIDLNNETEVCINLTEDLINSYEKKLLNMADEINATEFPYIKDCKCEYKIICYH